MIEVQNLTRVFRTYKKKPGFWAGVRGLFHREFDHLVQYRRSRRCHLFPQNPCPPLFWLPGTASAT